MASRRNLEKKKRGVTSARMNHLQWILLLIRILSAVAEGSRRNIHIIHPVSLLDEDFLPPTFIASSLIQSEFDSKNTKLFPEIGKIKNEFSIQFYYLNLSTNPNDYESRANALITKIRPKKASNENEKDSVSTKNSSFSTGTQSHGPNTSTQIVNSVNDSRTPNKEEEHFTALQDADDLIIVYGHYKHREFETLYDFYKKNDILVASPYFSYTPYEGILSFGPPDGDNEKAAASFIRSYRWKDVAIIRNSNKMSETIESDLRSALEDLYQKELTTYQESQPKPVKPEVPPVKDTLPKPADTGDSVPPISPSYASTLISHTISPSDFSVSSLSTLSSLSHHNNTMSNKKFENLSTFSTKDNVAQNPNGPSNDGSMPVKTELHVYEITSPEGNVKSKEELVQIVNDLIDKKIFAFYFSLSAQEMRIIDSILDEGGLKHSSYIWIVSKSLSLILYPAPANVGKVSFTQERNMESTALLDSKWKAIYEYLYDLSKVSSSVFSPSAKIKEYKAALAQIYKEENWVDPSCFTYHDSHCENHSIVGFPTVHGVSTTSIFLFADPRDYEDYPSNYCTNYFSDLRCLLFRQTINDILQLLLLIDKTLTSNSATTLSPAALLAARSPPVSVPLFLRIIQPPTSIFIPPPFFGKFNGQTLSVNYSISPIWFSHLNDSQGWKKIPPREWIPCQIGYTFSADHQKCLSCGPGSEGFIDPSSNEARCLKCRDGTVNPRSDNEQIYCTTCPLGKFRNDLFEEALGVPESNRGKYCYSCEPGQISVESGVLCTSCKKGFFSKAQSSQCDPCPVGMYSDGEGFSECLLCPSNLQTLYPGSISKNDCVCTNKTYYNYRSNRCEDCQTGSECPNGKDIPLILPGYWAMDVQDMKLFSSHSMYLCKNKIFCPGGVAGTCAPNRIGISCGRCLSGYYEKNLACIICDEKDSFLVPLFLILIAFLFSAFIYLATIQTAPGDPNSKRSSADSTTLRRASGMASMYQRTSMEVAVSHPVSGDISFSPSTLHGDEQTIAYRGIDAAATHRVSGEASLSYRVSSLSHRVNGDQTLLGRMSTDPTFSRHASESSRRSRIEETRQRAWNLSAASSLTVSLSLAASFLQNISVYQSLSINWPSSIRLIFDAVKVLMFDLSIFKFACAQPDEYRYSHLLKLFIPICLWISLWGMYFISQVLGHRLIKWVREPQVGVDSAISVLVRRFLRRGPMNYDHTISTTGQIYLLIYISMLKLSVVPFDCYRHPNGKRSNLVDSSFLCYESEWFKALPEVAFGLLLYIVLFNIVLFYLVFNIKNLLSKDKTLLNRFKFLVLRFHPQKYYFNAIILTRNIFFVLPNVLFPDQKTYQILYLTFISIAYIITVANLSPWSDKINNYLDILFMFALVFILLAGSLYSFIDDNFTTTANHKYLVLQKDVIAWIVFFLLITVTVITIAVVCYHLCKSLRDKKKRNQEILYQSLERQADARLLFHDIQFLQKYPLRVVERGVRMLHAHDLLIIREAFHILAAQFSAPKVARKNPYELIGAIQSRKCRINSILQDILRSRFESSFHFNMQLSNAYMLDKTEEERFQKPVHRQQQSTKDTDEASH